jgi:serine protease Do
MDEILLTDATERYLRGEMDEAERELFEQLRRTNTEVDQFVVEHNFFLQQMEQFGNTRAVKASLHEVHQQLLESGEISVKPAPGAKVISLWRKYKRTIAVAASIAGVVSLLTAGVVSSVTDKTTNPDLSKLKADVEDTKSQVRSTKNRVDQIDKRITSEPPAIVANYRATAFLIDGKGYLVTNEHVISGSTEVYVSNSKGQDLKATVIYTNKTTDVAILKIEDGRYKPTGALPYSIRRNNADLGEQIFTLGYPRQEIVYNEGYLSAKTGYNGDTTSCQVAISANPGNSGGPVVNSSGEVIGILTSKQAQADNVVFAVKSSNIFKALNEIRKDTAFAGIKLPARSFVSGLSRVQQIKKIEDCVFMVKVK